MATIGITGGKGGTGKSTVATALAFQLAKNHKVLLVDADVDCPNDHLLLNIDRKFFRSVTQRIPKWDMETCTKCGKCGTVCQSNAIVSIKGKEPIFMPAQCNGCGACVIKCPVDAIGWGEKEIGAIHTGTNHNIDLLSGELKTNEPVSEFVVNSLNELVKENQDKYDFVIIDTAAGTHCPVIAALEMCDLIYAVTEPTPLGSHDLELIMGLAAKLGKKPKIILNRSDIGDKTLTENIAKRYHADIVANIPYSDNIVKSYSHGIPVVDPVIKAIAGGL